jgi:hypothetical protein
MAVATARSVLGNATATASSVATAPPSMRYIQAEATARSILGDAAPTAIRSLFYQAGVPAAVRTAGSDPAIRMVSANLLHEDPSGAPRPMSARRWCETRIQAGLEPPWAVPTLQRADADPAARVLLGLDDPPTGATLTSDLLALGPGVPQTRRLYVANRLARCFRRPVQKNRWHEIHPVLAKQAEDHGRTEHEELLLRVQAAIFLGWNGVPGKRPLPGLGDVLVGDEVLIAERLRAIVNRVVTEDLLGHGHGLTDDDPQKRAQVEEIAEVGAKLESPRLVEADILRAICERVELSETEQLAVLVMCQDGRPADLAEVASITDNYAQQVFHRARKKLAPFIRRLL